MLKESECSPVYPQAVQSRLGQQPGVAVLSCALVGLQCPGEPGTGTGTSWQHHGTQPVPCSLCCPGLCPQGCWGGEEWQQTGDKAMVSLNETIIRFSKALFVFIQPRGKGMHCICARCRWVSSLESCWNDAAVPSVFL